MRCERLGALAETLARDEERKPRCGGTHVVTILAVPVFGLGGAVALGGAAYAAATSCLLPARWAVTSGIGACLAAPAVISYADSGFFSPDVQQQLVTNVLLLWLLVTPATLAKRHPGGIRQQRPISPRDASWNAGTQAAWPEVRAWVACSRWK